MSKNFIAFWIIAALFTYGVIDDRQESLPTKIGLFVCCLSCWPIVWGVAAQPYFELTPNTLMAKEQG